MTDQGFIYAATGVEYVALAARSAESLRAVMPNAQIHLFCDLDSVSGVFDKVHRLGRSHFRPKFEALRYAPFERTVYLDADTHVLAGISDIFDVLEHFDIAGAHVFRRNSRTCRRMHDEDIPNSFPQINTGVLGIRKSDRVVAFIEAVEREIDASGSNVDQPIFRELLLKSDLRLAVLPPEYNFKEPAMAAALSDNDAAPRVLHESNLHRRFDAATPTLELFEDMYGAGLVRHFRSLLAADRYLDPQTRETVRALARMPSLRKSSPLNRLRRRLGL